MIDSVRVFEDPFASEPAEIVRLYPAVAPKELRLLVGRPRPPFCGCPRAVKQDGRIIVWHQPSCDEPRLEGIL